MGFFKKACEKGIEWIGNHQFESGMIFGIFTGLTGVIAGTAQFNHDEQIRLEAETKKSEE